MTDTYDVQRSCASKTRYPSTEIAEQVAAKVLRERGVQLRAYTCSFCGGVHMTKQVGVVMQPKPGWSPAKISQRELASHAKRRHGARRRR